MEIKPYEKLELLDSMMEQDDQESKQFTIDNDNLANWASKKLKAMEQEKDRQLNIIEYFISEYKMKKDNINKKYESDTAFFKNQLEQYFQTVPKKSTKTTDTYSLPHGKLKLSKNKKDFIKDDKKLVEWLNSNGMKDKYIKVEESPKWADLKKDVIIKGDKVVTADGEIVEGIIVVHKADEFVIELD